MPGRKWSTASKKASFSKPREASVSRGFYFHLFKFELDHHGVVGRAESGGKRFGKSRSRADGLFDRGVHRGVAGRAGDPEECYRTAFRDFNFYLGIDSFPRRDGGLFP